VSGPRVGLLSAGQMGAAIGGVLVRHGGLEVLTSLDGRGDLTRERAREAGLRDVGDVATLAREADVLLSVMRPSGTGEATRAVADALRGSGHRLVFVECNAIPPGTALGYAELVAEAGGVFVDAAIQSPPPRGPGLILYESGPHAPELEFLRPAGIDLRALSGPVGQASALDMVVGGASKLFEAAALQVYLGARRWGLVDVLEDRAARLVGGVAHLAPLMPSRVARWAEEMVETAAFTRESGLPGGLFDGAAELFALVAGSERVRDGATAEWPASQRAVVELIAADLEQAAGPTG